MRYVRMSEDDIYVIIDGDDHLADKYVLGTVNGMYQDDTMLTYGKLTSLSGTWVNYGSPLTNTRTYRREQQWCTSHLKTFRKGLFDRINDWDLRNSEGKYFKVIGDQTIMYPMIEMAGVNRIKCAERTLYKWNDMHPGGEFHKLYEEEDKYIHNLPIYDEI